jgi:hypothetical protein
MNMLAFIIEANGERADLSDVTLKCKPTYEALRKMEGTANDSTKYFLNHVAFLAGKVIYESSDSIAERHNLSAQVREDLSDIVISRNSIMPYDRARFGVLRNFILDRIGYAE